MTYFSLTVRRGFKHTIFKAHRREYVGVCREAYRFRMVKLIPL